MQLIECTLGPANITILSINYSFDPNEEGRYVAKVHDDTHAAVMLSVAAYRVYDGHGSGTEMQTTRNGNDFSEREGYQIKPEVLNADAQRLPKRGPRRRGA